MFRFSLATLLRIRLLREEQERALLQEAQSKLSSAISEVARLHNLRKQAIETVPPSCVTAAELQFVRMCGDVVLGAEKNAKQGALDQERRCDEQRKRYSSARMQKEILEKLRDRQKEQYAVEERRQEQRRLDEAYTVTRGNTDRQALPSNPARFAGSE